MFISNVKKNDSIIYLNYDNIIVFDNYMLLESDRIKLLINSPSRRGLFIRLLIYHKYKILFRVLLFKSVN